MERETLEKLIKVLNNAIDKDDNFDLEEEISTILGNNKIFKLPKEPENSRDKFYNNEAIISIINLLKHIKSQLEPENQEFFINNIHELLKPFIQDDKTKKRICLDDLSDEYDEQKLAGYITDNYRMQVIRSIDEDDIKISLLDTVEDDFNRVAIIESLKDEQNKIKTLNKVDNDDRKIIISKLSTEIILKNIREILHSIGITDKVEEKIEMIKRLASRNPHLFETLEWRILEEKYFEIFTEEQMDIVCSYLQIQAKILNRLNDKKLDLLKNVLKCLDNQDILVFQLQFIKLIDILSLNKSDLEYEINNYDELIQNLNFQELTEDDFDKLAYVLQSPNFFRLKTIDDIRHYEGIRDRVCDSIVKGESEKYQEKYQCIPYGEERQLQFAVLSKLFGIDIESAESIVRKYGNDIKYLPDEEPEVKYVKSLQIILNANKELLRQIYDIDNTIFSSYINPSLLEINLRYLYGREFNKGLCHAEDLEIQEDGIYRAGNKFRMIVTSVGAYVENNPENFKEDWNRDSTNSQGVCCSYITNDLIATAHVNHFLYGFNEMGENALMLSGISDLYSNTKQFNPEALDKEVEVYYAPENQINNTIQVFMGDTLNEMVFKRIQDGKRKQPDYIVVIDGYNLEEAKKAARQWGKDGVPMPIVVIDTEECRQNNKKEIEQMIIEFRTSEDLQKIRQRIENNKKWGSYYDDLEGRLRKLEEQYEKGEYDIINGFKGDTRLKSKEQELSKLEEESTRIAAQEEKYGIGIKNEYLNR